MAILITFPTVSFAETLLREAEPGRVITFSGKQWMILDHTDETTYIILNNNDGNRPFDSGWGQRFDPNRASNIAYYLNNTFYNNLTQKELIEDYLWVIKNDRGIVQNNVKCKIGLISYEEFFSYKSLFLNGNPLYAWTRSPVSSDSRYVWNADSASNTCKVGTVTASSPVRPTLYIKSGLVLSDTNEVIKKPIVLKITEKSHNFIQLSWYTLEKATEYIIFRNGVEITRASGTQYVDTKVQGNSEYSYTIKAIFSDQDIQSSDPVSAKTMLSPVENFMAIPNSHEEVQLSWEASSDPGLAGYIIYRNGQEIAWVNGSQTMYTDPKLTPATIYSYSIQSYNSDGEKSLMSPVQMVITEAYPKPELRASAKGNNINLSWSGVADYYLINVNGEEIGTTNGKNYTYIGKAGVSYTFEVVASIEEYLIPSNKVEIRLSPIILTDVSVSEIVKNVSEMVKPAGSIIAFGLALKASPLLISLARSLFLRL
ncbi:fibronectin type 3 domain-containing protein [Desulforamulus aeronauticus DSM 10349]|uniref:Fibronectin type 3 domain-containing protein n=2 Tax=Desulforamulus aeronauticus TaxID=53343 RepID=A0A1M6WFI8_9FIRM|nr:fibronectin type 3 domain-containing protein [Desulforamulus aeronauticus DSM 10349]